MPYRARNSSGKKVLDYRFNLFIRFFIETYMGIIVTCLITFYAHQGGDTIWNSSLAAAAIFYVAYTGMYVSCWLLMTLRYKELPKEASNHMWYKERFSSFYSELKLDRKVNGLYHPVMLTHRTLIAYTLIFVTWSYQTQLAIILVSQLWVILDS